LQRLQVGKKGAHASGVHWATLLLRRDRVARRLPGARPKAAGFFFCVLPPHSSHAKYIRNAPRWCAVIKGSPEATDRINSTLAMDLCLFVCLFATVGIKPEKLYSASCAGREAKGFEDPT